MRTARISTISLTFFWVLGALATTPAASAQSAPFTGTAAGGVSVVLEPPQVIRVGEDQAWSLRLRRSDGKPVTPLSLAFAAGMPAHGHGLPEPAAIEATDAGRFRIAPVRFNMGGAWRLEVTLGSPGGLETVVFDLELPDGAGSAEGAGLDAAQVALIRSLALVSLTPTPRDASNRFSGNPAAAELGRALFREPALSTSGTIACVSCHEPGRAFTDGRARAFGSRELARNAPTLVGVGHARWFYWDGRRDSLWAQALTPLETRGEMDGNRTDVVRLVTSRPEYAAAFSALRGTQLDVSDRARFPPGSGPFAGAEGKAAWARMADADRERVNTAFADVGKVLAAFEETLIPPVSRFDRFAAALGAIPGPAGNVTLDERELRGLRLFLDVERTQCLRCHNGPLLTNQGFHAIGSASHAFDLGFELGLQAAAVDPFNCTGAFSDARSDCRLQRMRASPPGLYSKAFKVPTLRQLTLTGPYFHDGRFASLEAVLEFYAAPPAPDAGNHELTPVVLDDDERSALAAFLRTLSAPAPGYSSMTR